MQKTKGGGRGGGGFGGKFPSLAENAAFAICVKKKPPNGTVKEVSVNKIKQHLKTVKRTVSFNVPLNRAAAYFTKEHRNSVKKQTAQ